MGSGKNFTVGANLSQTVRVRVRVTGYGVRELGVRDLGVRELGVRELGT